MYMNKIGYPICLASLLLLAGCHKYLDIQPKGKIIPTTLNDFQLLMNNSAVFNLCGGTTDLMTDDVAFTDTSMFTSLRPLSLLNIYTWASGIYQANEDDPEWNLYYQQVYYCNVVITGVPDASNGTDRDKAALIAQAKVHRAYAYLCLVNQYARQYDTATAAQDPGLPLLLEPIYSQSLKRASVKAIYDQIMADLQSAVPALPGLPLSKTAPSQAAAYAILARASLYMGNYINARLYADSSLSLQYTLFDLRPYAASTTPFDFLGIPTSNNNPEVILMKAAYNEDAPILLSQELLDLLGPDDLRAKVFAIGGQLLLNYNGYFFSYISPLEGRHEGPRVGEIYLIKAECQARAGDGPGAMQTVNLLRQQRFDPSKYIPLTASDPTDALVKVLQERRRELMGRGFRFIDLRRLNKDPAFARSIVHPLANGSITLDPNNNRYVYPIAPKVLGTNPEIGQNPR
ncbi:RagB/SusD family nutrient uptake outer membrane protein [Flavitalea flava]